MSMLAEKMEKAGVDTVGAQLTAACTEALRRAPRDPVKAWQLAGELFGYEFIHRLIADMDNAPTTSSVVEAIMAKATAPVEVPRTTPIRPEYKPRVIPPERLEHRRKLREVVRSKYMNSAGVSWSDVGWHELPALRRDGNEAAALLAAGPASVPNDGRTVGQVLSGQEIDRIIEGARK